MRSISFALLLTCGAACQSSMPSEQQVIQPIGQREVPVPNRYDSNSSGDGTLSSCGHSSRNVRDIVAALSADNVISFRGTVTAVGDTAMAFSEDFESGRWTRRGWPVTISPSRIVGSPVAIPVIALLLDPSLEMTMTDNAGHRYRTRDHSRVNASSAPTLRTYLDGHTEVFVIIQRRAGEVLALAVEPIEGDEVLAEDGRINLDRLQQEARALRAARVSNPMPAAPRIVRTPGSGELG